MKPTEYAKAHVDVMLKVGAVIEGTPTPRHAAVELLAELPELIREHPEVFGLEWEYNHDGTARHLWGPWSMVVSD